MRFTVTLISWAFYWALSSEVQIRHATARLHHPQSTRKAENIFKIIKHIDLQELQMLLYPVEFQSGTAEGFADTYFLQKTGSLE